MTLWKLARPGARPEALAARPSIAIRWQRLLLPDSEAGTCPRCAGTQGEVRRAAERLRASLAPLGFGVTLEEGGLDRAAFDRDPLQSNRIWVDGVPLEELVGAREGRTPCCGDCGDADCRTVEAGGTAHEVVPADLVVAAGLAAAARRLCGGLTA